MSPAGTVAFFREHFGPTQVAFDRLDEAGRAALSEDLIALWSTANIAPDRVTHALVKNQFLQVTATRM